MCSSWQWHRCLRHNLDTPQAPILRRNLDETNISLNYDYQKGIVTSSTKRSMALVKKTSKARDSLTHAALICDDSSIQPVLPQLIIANHCLLRVKDLRQLAPHLPKNVILVRATSSWITVELVVVLLETLRKRLTQHEVKKTPVLLMDSCPVHLHPLVWTAAKRMGIHLFLFRHTLHGSSSPWTHVCSTK